MTIPPTAAAESPDEQLQNSLETLNELFTAIDNGGEPYPGGRRTIQLQAGVYDFRALVRYPEPGTETPPPLPGYTLIDPDEWPFEQQTYYLYDPHGRYAPDVGRGGGLPIVSRQNLTIQGTMAGDAHQTTVLGIPDTEAFHVDGGFGPPSRNITIRDLRFDGPRMAVAALGRLPTFEPFEGPKVVNGTGTEDLLVENNEIVGSVIGVFVWGRHLRATVRRNRVDHAFIGMNCGGDPALQSHLVDLLVEDNVFENVFEGIDLLDRHDGTVVRDNRIEVGSQGVPGVGHGIVVVDGSHGFVPRSLEDAGARIEGNEVDADVLGIVVVNAIGWDIRRNRIPRSIFGIATLGASSAVIASNYVSDAAVYGLLLEQGMYFDPQSGTLWSVPSADLRVKNNTIRNSGVAGALLGPAARDNVLSSNDLGENGIAVLLTDQGSDPYAFRGRPSGNVIRDDGDGQGEDGPGNPSSAPIIDASGCYPDDCPPIDGDGDGSFDEDEVDGLDNDGDGFIDEDPSDQPNDVDLQDE